MLFKKYIWNKSATTIYRNITCSSTPLTILIAKAVNNKTRIEEQNIKGNKRSSKDNNSKKIHERTKDKNSPVTQANVKEGNIFPLIETLISGKKYSVFIFISYQIIDCKFSCIKINKTCVIIDIFSIFR